MMLIRVSPHWRFVLSDGAEFSGSLPAETYASTVRHEFAHAFAHRAGLDG